MKQYLIVTILFSTLYMHSMDQKQYHKVKRTKKNTLKHMPYPTQREPTYFKFFRVDGTGPYQCPRKECAQRHETRKDFKSHLLQGHHVSAEKMAQYMMVTRFHTNELQCPDCHFVFPAKAQEKLILHVARHHNIPPYYCMESGCSKNFFHHCALKNHLRYAHWSSTPSASSRKTSDASSSPRPLEEHSQQSDAHSPIADELISPLPQEWLAPSGPGALSISDLLPLNFPTDAELGLE